jgi:uncharacterized protein (DUF1501 family)
MNVTRRHFLRGGVAAFTVGFGAPQFLSDLAFAQGASARTLVVLYLGGGNDSLSTVIPYSDAQYHARRPSIAVPAGSVLQIGSDAAGTNIGLHPRLTGLKSIFESGHLAIVQRTGYPNQSRSHFLGTDIWSTGDPNHPSGAGWLGRYLDSLPSPLDPLVGWNTSGDTPRTLLARNVPVPAIPSVSAYTFAAPNTGAEAQLSRTIAARIASHVPVERPHLSLVSATVTSAMATLDRVAQVGRYAPSVTYPTSGLGQAFRAIAGAIVQGVGTKVFWVQTGGYDTHSGQGVNATNGSYYGLMATIDDAMTAFYNDLRNQGALRDTLILQFSEFGRRIAENGSAGTDHGAASVMMLAGGSVRGGLVGTAPNLNPAPDNPTLENSGGDVRMETDFRSVYAEVIEKWLGTSSVPLLGGDYRKPGLSLL